MGAFWTGFEKACSHARRGRAPLLLSEMRSVLGCAVSGESVLRCAVGTSELGDNRNGLDRFLNFAVDLRAAASMRVGFFALRRPSEIAQLVDSGGIADGAACLPE